MYMYIQREIGSIGRQGAKEEGYLRQIERKRERDREREREREREKERKKERKRE